MSAERLEEITERHLNRPRLDGTPWCTYCSQRFPCDVKVALAEVERLRSERNAAIGAASKYLAEVERLRKAIQTVLDDNETGAGGWGPDVTMAEVLRAAMEGEK